MRKDVVSELGWGVVTNKLEESNLKVCDDEDLVH